MADDKKLSIALLLKETLSQGFTKINEVINTLVGTASTATSTLNQLKNAGNELNKSADKVAASLNKASVSFKGFATSSNRASMEAKANAVVTSQTSDSSKKAGTAKVAETVATEKLSASTKKSTQATDSDTKAVEKNTTARRKRKTVIDEGPGKSQEGGVAGQTQNADMEAKGYEQQLAKRFSAFKSHGMALGTVFTTLGAIVTASFVKMNSDFMAFEDRILEVQAVLGYAKEDMGELTTAAQRIGRETVFAGSEAAAGLKYLAQAGFEAKESIAALPTVLRLAQAGEVSVAESAAIVTHVMAAYQMTTDELVKTSDGLAVAANKTNASLSDMGVAFSYVGPMAKQVGVDVSELSATIGLLHNAGIQGSRAGTSLRQAIIRLLSPTRETEKVLASLAARTGEAAFEVADANGKFIGFANLIEKLKNAGASGAEVMTIFGARAGPAMAALMLMGSDAVRKLTDEVGNSDDALKRMQETMDSGMTGALKRFTSSISDFSVAAIEPISKVFGGFLRFAAQLINNFAELLRSIPILGSAISVLVGGIGLVSVALGASLVFWTLFGKSVKTLIDGLLGTWTAFTALGATVPIVTAEMAAFTVAAGGAAKELLAFDVAAAGLAAGVGASFTAAVAPVGILAKALHYLRMIAVGAGIAVRFLFTTWTGGAILAVMAAAAYLYNSYRKTKDATEELGKSVYDLNSKYNQHINVLKELGDTIQDTSGAKSIEERIAASKRLVQMYPELIAGQEKDGSSLALINKVTATNIELNKERVKSYEELLSAQKKSMEEAQLQVLIADNEDYMKVLKKRADATARLNEMQTAHITYGPDKEYTENIVKAYKVQTELNTQVKVFEDKYKGAAKYIAESARSLSMVDFTKALDTKGVIGDLRAALIQGYIEYTTSIKQSTDTLAVDLSRVDDKHSKALRNISEDLDAALKDGGTAVADKLAITAALSDQYAKKTVMDLGTIFVRLNSEFDAYTKEMDTTGNKTGEAYSKLKASVTTGMSATANYLNAVRGAADKAADQVKSLKKEFDALKKATEGALTDIDNAIREVRRESMSDASKFADSNTQMLRIEQEMTVEVAKRNPSMERMVELKSEALKISGEIKKVDGEGKAITITQGEADNARIKPLERIRALMAEGSKKTQDTLAAQLELATRNYNQFSLMANVLKTIIDLMDNLAKMTNKEYVDPTSFDKLRKELGDFRVEFAKMQNDVSTPMKANFETEVKAYTTGDDLSKALAKQALIPSKAKYTSIDLTINPVFVGEDGKLFKDVYKEIGGGGFGKRSFKNIPVEFKPVRNDIIDELLKLQSGESSVILKTLVKTDPQYQELQDLLRADTTKVPLEILAKYPNYIEGLLKGEPVQLPVEVKDLDNKVATAIAKYKEESKMPIVATLDPASVEQVNTDEEALTKSKDTVINAVLHGDKALEDSGTLLAKMADQNSKFVITGEVDPDFATKAVKDASALVEASPPVPLSVSVDKKKVVAEAEKVQKVFSDAISKGVDIGKINVQTGSATAAAKEIMASIQNYISTISVIVSVRTIIDEASLALVKRKFEELAKPITKVITVVQGNALGGMIEKYAVGGRLSGYGGGDILPALLEPGEFVVRKEAVQKYGEDIFRRLNSMMLPPLRYAAGGSVGAQSSKTSLRRDVVDLNFNLGRSTYPLSGDRSVVEELMRALKREELMK